MESFDLLLNNPKILFISDSLLFIIYYLLFHFDLKNLLFD